MARYIVILFLFIFFGCEMNGGQIIKPQDLNFDILKFNVVSKKLNNNYLNNSPNHQKISQIIDYWFNNKVKSNGYNGSLEINIKKIDIKEIKEKDYYKFSIKLEIDFIENTIDPIQNKTYEVNASEYGQISGSFSIEDQEKISLNTMHKSLSSISKKLLELI